MSHFLRVMLFMRHVGQEITAKPRMISEFRMKLIEEEWKELQEAFALRDMARVIDALADLEYVILGSFVDAGVDGDRIFDVVHDANMRKTPMGYGKATKPPGWAPPDIELELHRMGYEGDILPKR